MHIYTFHLLFCTLLPCNAKHWITRDFWILGFPLGFPYWLPIHYFCFLWPWLGPPCYSAYFEDSCTLDCYGVLLCSASICVSIYKLASIYAVIYASIYTPRSTRNSHVLARLSNFLICFGQGETLGIS